jgi:hypothetical protein
MMPDGGGAQLIKFGITVGGLKLKTAQKKNKKRAPKMETCRPAPERGLVPLQPVLPRELRRPRHQWLADGWACATFTRPSGKTYKEYYKSGEKYRSKRAAEQAGMK